MSSKRLHLVMVVILGLLFIGILAGAYGSNKLLATKANQLTLSKAKNQALNQEQITLSKAKKDIQTYDNLNKIAQSVVPQDKNQAEAVREIVNIAADNDVTLASINFPASTLGLLPSGAAGAASGTASTGTTAPSANTKTAGLSQLTAVKNIPGVYQLPITISNDTNHPVQYEKFISFLSDLEHNRRTAQVGTITIQPDAKNPDFLTFSLTLSEYIKP